MSMTWNVYGKLLTAGNVTYHYDAAGNRIRKTVGTTNTWHVLDAQGNTLTK